MFRFVRVSAFAVAAMANLIPAAAHALPACSVQYVWMCDGDECGPFWDRNRMYQQYRKECCDGVCTYEPIYPGDTCCDF